MKKLQLRHKRDRMNKKQMYPFYAGGVLLLTLGVALCVTWVSRSHTVALLNYSRDNLILSIRGNITSMMHAYDEMSLPGADVKNELLPSMRMNLYAIDEMNDVLVDAHGQESAVLNKELIEEIQVSLDDMQSAIEMGRTISEQHKAMGVCMEHVRQALLDRFGNENTLMPMIAST